MLRWVRNFWRRVGERLRNALQDGTRQRITRLGFSFICFMTGVGAAAFVSGNNLLFLLFASLLAAFLVSGFVSRLGLAGLELDLKVPTHVTARRPIAAQVQVRNRKWLFPSFSLQLSGAPGTGFKQDLSLPLVAARETLKHPVQLQFEHRGLYRDNAFYFSSRFPFGFAQRRAEVFLKQELLVYPSIEAQPGFDDLLRDVSGEIESRQRGLGTDFYRIRPYVQSESARHVDWRATAHTGDLQLREFVKEQNRSVAIFLDSQVTPETSDWFETAVECSAFLVTQLVAKGVSLQFVSQGYARRIPEDADAYDILKFLACVEPCSDACPAPLDENSVQIAISARPEKLASFGLDDARVLSLMELEPARAANHPRDAKASSREDHHHGDGAGRGGDSRVRHDPQQGANPGAARGERR